MTTYQCDTCDGETPGGAAGTSFLVRPNGTTFHFCSSACLRAYVNGSVVPMPWFVWMSVGGLIGAFAQVVIAQLFK